MSHTKQREANGRSKLAAVLPWIGALTSLLSMIAGAGLWGVRVYKEQATTPLVGCLVRIPQSERKVNGQLLPSQTTLMYVAFNPGPGVLENIELRVSIEHPETEKLDEWLDVRAIGPAKKNTTEEDLRTTFHVSPSSGGNPTSLAPRKDFGVLLTAINGSKWEPDSVSVSWGHGEQVSAKANLPLKELMEQEQSPTISPFWLFVVGVFFSVYFVGQWYVSSRKRKQILSLETQVSEKAREIERLEADVKTRETRISDAVLVKLSEAIEASEVGDWSEKFPEIKAVLDEIAQHKRHNEHRPPESEGTQ